MNTKRIIFWVCFVIVLGLIIWGLIVAMNKGTTSATLGTPAPVSTTTDHIRGAENAAVTLIEYSDFQCPACQTYFPVVDKLRNDASTTLRVVYRHYPLPQHANARISAQASEAAGLQGKFWEMHDMLFPKHAEWTELSDPKPVFEGYARSLGLDVTKFMSDLESASVKDMVQAQVDEGVKLGIRGTPTFFVNGEAIETPQGYAAFKTIIDAAITGSQE